ncbi:M56 family peptidase [Janthinobacterium lividum]
MLVPLTVAVPWPAAEATATDVAAPPLRFRVIGLALLPYATVALTAPATGTLGVTVIVTMASADVPPPLLAV